MFSVVFSAPLTTTHESVVSAFESLDFGEFQVASRLSHCKGKECIKYFVNYSRLHESATEFRERLVENEVAQRDGERFWPVKVYYENHRGREHYWQVYKTKTPDELQAARAARAAEPYKVRVELGKGGRL